MGQDQALGEGAQPAAQRLHLSAQDEESPQALLDQAVTQASSLGFQTKQAEAVIASLRQEREITDKVRAAVTQLREERQPKPKSA